MSAEIARVVITRILGEYLENIDSENIAVGLWSGHLSLENLNLKPSAFDKFNFPMKIKYGKVDKIEMSIPYKSILMGISSSVQIYIENIKIYTKSNSQKNWEFFDYTNFDFKKDLIKSFTEDILLKINISENPKLNNTYVNRMINNIIDNIKINIKNFVVIYEDENSHNLFNFYLGLQCKEISINSLEKDELEYSKIVKELKLLDFSLFLIPFDKKKRINFDLSIGNKLVLNDLYSNIEANSSNYSSHLDLSMENIEILENVEKIETKILKEYFIINPINLLLELRRNEDNSKYKVDIKIDSIEIEIERKQFACILKNLEFINKYTQFYNNCYFYRRLKFFKPELEVIHSLGKNLSTKDMNDIIEQNRLLKKNYYFKFLRHYFNAVHKLIQEKRFKLIKQLFIDLKKLKEYKDIFIKSYPKFYLNCNTLGGIPLGSEYAKMKDIIRYVDKEILCQWIKEIVGDIYTEEKKVEQKSGFFGGIKSYFYKSAVDNIKYDEKILQKIKSDGMIFMISMQMNTCGLTISERRIKNNNKISESSKFIIKDILTTVDKTTTSISDRFSLDVQITEFKMSSITKMNSSSFSNDIILPIQKILDTDKIFLLNYKKVDLKSNLYVNLFSQAFIYNQNFIENISRFFNIAEFDQYSNIIKTSEILAFDLDLLQKYNIDNKTSESQDTVINIIVNNQKLIFPFKNVDYNSDLLILNLGDFSISTENGKIYIAQSTNIKIEYDRKFSVWLEKQKFKKSLPQELQPIITTNSDSQSNEILLLNEFSLHLIIDLVNFKFTCSLSDINLNVNSFIVKKLVSFPGIFKINYESDIWESVYENKTQIFNNSSKRGTVMLKEKSSLFADKWKKYFCLLSGGYLYLFEKPDNLKADVLIGLKHAEITDSTIEENVDIFPVNISYKKTNLNYVLGFTSENIKREWRKLISDRIEEIKSYSNESEGSILGGNITGIDSSYVLVENNIIDKSNKAEKKQLDRFKYILELFSNHKNLKNKFNFDFNLNHLGINLLLDKDNESISEEKFIIEFENFNLNVKINELYFDIIFDLSKINLKHFKRNNLLEAEATNILSNKLTYNEKLINFNIIIYNSEIYEEISNPLNNLDIILLKLPALNEEVINMIKNLPKIDMKFELSNMTLLFDPHLINNLYISIIKLTENLKEQDKQEIIVDIKDERFSSDLSLTMESSLISEGIVVVSNTSTHSIIKLSALFKSLDLIIINKKTNLKLFSFNLGESRVDVNQFYSFLRLKLNLGNFQINEHLNFPHKLNLDHENVYSNTEILGLADKNKNSSLFLDLIIYNSGSCPTRDNQRVTMKIDILLESIKVNFIYKIIMRIVDSLLYDIIPVFNTPAVIVIDQKVQTENKIEIKKKNLQEIKFPKKNDKLIETFELSIIVNNPTVILFDVINQDLFYQIDFGKIFVKNNLLMIPLNEEFQLQNEKNNCSSLYYETYEIEFKNTTIICSDKFSICQPLNTSILFSSLKSVEYAQSAVESQSIYAENEVKIYVKVFDFEIRKTDYLNIFKLIKNNLALDDFNDILLFDKEINAPITKIINKTDKTDKINNSFPINILIVQENKYNFSLKFFNEIFKLKIINEKLNYIQLLLTECDFNLNQFTNNLSLKVSSKNIYIKDNTISILSNKKGIEKLQNIKNYSQFNLTYRDDFINNEAQVDLSLIDMKFFLKLDLINFIQDFIIREEEEENYENKEEKLNNQIVERDKQVIKNEKEKKMVINLAILNNVIFLKSENNFEEQEILACETDITAKININPGDNKLDVEYDKIKYEVEDKLNVNFALQGFYVYTAKILSFESDFETIYNKRKLIEPFNLFANIKNRNLVNLNNKREFNKNEIFIDIDTIKVKVSYGDFFFIFNSVMLNINNIINQAELKENNFKVISESDASLDNKQKDIVDNIDLLKKEKLEKLENSLEFYLNLKTIDLFVINDLNDMFCPILQIVISNLDNTLFIDLNQDLNMKFKNEIMINYFNYKISIWEPLIENFDLVYIQRQENKILNIKSNLNINVTEEFIFLLKNSIESFKINYNKNYSEKKIDPKSFHNNKEGDETELNVSNHILINYSGDSLIITKTLLDGSKSEISICNGESVDINNIFIANQSYSHLDLDKEFTLSLESVFDEIKFSNKNISIKNFHLISSNEIENNQQQKKLIDNNILYIVELNKIRRNYIFYSKFVFENHTDLKFSSAYGEIKPNHKIGIKDFDKSDRMELKYKDENTYINYDDIIKNENGFIKIDFIKAKCVLSISKETFQYMNHESTIYRLKIHPTFTLENYLSFPIVLIEDKDYIESSKSVINPSEKKLIYNNFNFDFKLFKFLIDGGKDNSFYSEEMIEVVPVLQSHSDNQTDRIRNLEKTIIVHLINTINKDKKFIIKLNYIREKENGIMKIFLYSDYLIINTTSFDIYPSLPEIKNSYNEPADSDERINKSFLNFTPQKVKFKHYLNELNSLDYFSVENFEDLQLNLINVHSPNTIYKSEKIHIIPENYAFIKEIDLFNQDDTNDEEFYQFVVERYIKYVKFTSLKKIDMLVIKPKYKIRNNLNYDIVIFSQSTTNNSKLAISENKNIIIKSKSEEIIHTKKSLINFKILNKDNEPTNETEWINLNNFLSEGIVLNREDEDFFITILNETYGFTSILTVFMTDNTNSSILLENKTEYIVKLYQITKEDSDCVNTYTLYPNQVKAFNWTKMLISKYIKIDLIDPKTNVSVDYYVMDYDNKVDKNKQNEQFAYNFAKQKEIILKVVSEGNLQKFLFLKKRSLDVAGIISKQNELASAASSTVTLIKIISQLIVSINEVNICIVNYDYKVKNLRSELANLSITKLSIIYIEEIRNNIDKFQTVELKLKTLQLDNISNNQLSPYKVNIFKIQNEDEGNNTDNSSELPLIHFLLEVKASKSHIVIEKLEFLIQSFGICLDSEFLFEIFKFIKSLQINVDTSLYYKNNNEILNIIINSTLSIEKPTSSDDLHTNTRNKIFINLLRTSPINFLFSYKNISNSLFDEFNITSSIVKNIIDVFTNNEKVNIQLKAVEMNKVFGDSSQILEKIVHYYYYNLISQALKLFFSIDILGNPLNLLQNLGSGVKDFFYLPVQGFINGPFEFVYGSISGTKSLVSHTIGGALDSTEKIASSLGKNLLKLSNSEDYIKERQRIFLDPENKTNKFKTSLKIIYLGVKYGTRDFLFLPYFYLKNDGILYLPKGVLLGITSIFVKPVSGVLDFLSFVSGDLSKRFLQAYEATFHNLKRKRTQRIFWGVNKYIKSNDKEEQIIEKMITDFESDMQNYYDLSSNIYFKQNNFIIKKVIFFRQKSGLHAGMFIGDNIFFVDAYAMTMEKHIAMTEINDIIVNNLDVKIIYENKKKALRNCEYDLEFENMEIKDSFINFVYLIWKK